MRSFILLLMGILEAAFAGCLGYLACRLPTGAEVDHGFEVAQRVNQRASNQVQLFRQQINQLRHPETLELAHRLDEQTRKLTEMLRSQTLDFNTVAMLPSALSDIAAGIEGFAETINPEDLNRLSRGLGRSAVLLETEIMPRTLETAESLEVLGEVLADDARKFSELVKNAPGDLSGIQELHESLGKFSEGLQALEVVLRESAGKGDKDAKCHPPQLREAVEESRKMVDRGREALRLVLRNREALEPMLKDAPAQLARVAEEFPRLTNDMTKQMKDPRLLKDLATGLRQSQSAVDAVVERWPELRATLGTSAEVLRSTSGQLAHALEHRDEYERTLDQTVQVMETFATMVPLMAEQMTTHLDDQHNALDDLGQSIDDAGRAIPQYRETALHALLITRVLLWLLVAIIALHALHSLTRFPAP